MRTTIRLDDALLRQAKAMAAKSGRSLNDFIVEAVRAAIARRPSRAPVELPSYKGNGLLPSVDLDDSSALLDLMESSYEPRVMRVAEPSPRRKKR